MADEAKIVLFACVHNAGRSQMANALFNSLADPAKAKSVSAGTQPGTQVHPVCQEAMLELGIDLSGQQPQKLTEELAQTTNLLITMGCGEACPYVPGLKKEDWPLPDPKGQGIEAVRETRDKIKALVLDLLEREGWGR